MASRADPPSSTPNSVRTLRRRESSPYRLCASEPGGEFDHPLLRQRLVGQPVGEGTAGEVAEHEGGQPVVGADRVDARHARIVDAGEQRGLAPKRGEQAGCVLDRAFEGVRDTVAQHPVHRGGGAAAQLGPEPQPAQLVRHLLGSSHPVSPPFARLL
nr:hypothetical protein [Actinoplanes aureus]